MREIRGENIAVPASAGTAPPTMAAPEGAVDCHIHIYDPRYPFVAGRSPGKGTVEDLLLFRRRLGLSRSIVVAPSSYGFDNRCLVDALDRLGDSARGVASIDVDIADKELERLHSHGVRGIRLNPGRIAGTSVGDITHFAKRLQPLDWHIQLNMHAPQLIEAEELLSNLPVTLVIDHMGRPKQPGGLDNPLVPILRRLIDKGNTYVKLSYIYEEGGVRYADYAPLASHLVRVAPERLVWGSDWPHGNKDVKPDDAMAFDQLAVWAPVAATRRRILVDNPNALYWRDQPLRGERN